MCDTPEKIIYSDYFAAERAANGKLYIYRCTDKHFHLTSKKRKARDQLRLKFQFGRRL